MSVYLDGTGTVDCSFISEEFYELVGYSVSKTWTDLDLGMVYRRAKLGVICNLQVTLANALLEHGMIEKSKELFEQALATANKDYDGVKSEVLPRTVKSLFRTWDDREV